ncbi:MAG: large-conductance mechanosensitive channel protein MscL [Tepidisphaera sp.]|nr:large-conductance mechanosensitive channel protein MscL [Tepidisphaera sp.]
MGFIQEFRDFAVKGNVFDMAVGVIVGGAFGKLAGSFVNDIMLPPIGMAAGKVDFSDLKLVLQKAEPATETTKAVAEVAISYGKFISTSIDFILMAFAVFLLVKVVASLKKKEPAAAPPPPPGPTKDQQLLMEIRDLLKR